ncbi:MAG: PPC domain-containing DNA-binding protein [Bacillota bacterium]
MKEYGVKRVFMGRLKPGDDLLLSLEAALKEAQVTMGSLTLIGALRSATVGYYDQDKREYLEIKYPRHLEILSGVGNISRKDGKLMVHCHVTLGDSEGRAFGGHLLPGTEVFACEYMVFEFDGPVLERGFDDDTGLSLWQLT